MEYEMNRLGWWFAGCEGGRLKFAKDGASVLFKDWGKVGEFVNEQKAKQNGEEK